MAKALFVAALTTVTLLSRAASFQFSIARELNSTTEMDKAKWIMVEVIEKGLDEGDSENIVVKIHIPLSERSSGVFIFFANDNKEILQVNLDNMIEGKFYIKPYKVTKKLKGEETTKFIDENFVNVFGSFPKAWLPEKSNKISAAVRTFDGKWYNYYGLQNFGISILDLMVVEEFKNHEFF